jgi:hypothetical protein
MIYEILHGVQSSFNFAAALNAKLIQRVQNDPAVQSSEKRLQGWAESIKLLGTKTTLSPDEALEMATGPLKGSDLTKIHLEYGKLILNPIYSGFYAHKIAVYEGIYDLGNLLNGHFSKGFATNFMKEITTNKPLTHFLEGLRALGGHKTCPPDCKDNISASLAAYVRQSPKEERKDIIDLISQNERLGYHLSATCNFHGLILTIAGGMHADEFKELVIRTGVMSNAGFHLNLGYKEHAEAIKNDLAVEHLKHFYPAAYDDTKIEDGFMFEGLTTNDLYKYPGFYAHSNPVNHYYPDIKDVCANPATARKCQNFAEEILSITLECGK